MKTNKILPTFIALVLWLAFLSISASAQRRRAPRRTVNPPTAETIVPSNIEVKNGAEKVSIQLKNVTRFIYLLGGVARVVEDLDKDIAAGKASPAASDLNAKNKRAVGTTIKNLRDGLAALEVEFRTKPGLKNYLVQINGITDIGGRAEDQAAAGQLVESGKTLLLVVEKLADTLAAMP